MEDLSDYQMRSRSSLLNLRESEMIMEWQAKFHASGLVYYGEKGPEDECMVLSLSLPNSS
jgi:hypothetical protein